MNFLQLEVLSGREHTEAVLLGSMSYAMYILYVHVGLLNHYY